MVELLRNILPKSVAGATRRNTPPASIIRIGPEKVAHRAFVRNLLESIKGANLVECVNRRRQATMQTEDLINKLTHDKEGAGDYSFSAYLILNQSSQRQIIEQIGEVFPNIWRSILPKALIIEAIADHKIRK
jgi:hypothetical protein